MPTARRSSSERLVNTVTAINSGAVRPISADVWFTA